MDERFLERNARLGLDLATVEHRHACLEWRLWTEWHLTVIDQAAGHAAGPFGSADRGETLRQIGHDGRPGASRERDAAFGEFGHAFNCALRRRRAHRDKTPE